MGYIPKENSGSLFRNDRKETENQPDHKGQACVNGKLYWVSAWVNETKAGQKYFNMKFTPRDDKPKSESDYTPPSRDFDEDIPF